eukprot:36946-Eustigmatos_ZCMA.PRE.1
MAASARGVSPTVEDKASDDASRGEHDSLPCRRRPSNWSMHTEVCQFFIDAVVFAHDTAAAEYCPFL